MYTLSVHKGTHRVAWGYCIQISTNLPEHEESEGDTKKSNFLPKKEIDYSRHKNTSI